MLKKKSSPNYTRAELFDQILMSLHNQEDQPSTFDGKLTSLFEEMFANMDPGHVEIWKKENAELTKARKEGHVPNEYRTLPPKKESIFYRHVLSRVMNNYYCSPDHPGRYTRPN